MKQRVVLAPGLWMPAAAMALLATRLARRGYRAEIFAYSGRGSFEDNVERLARFGRQAAYFVGHSLGGVLMLEMLNRHPEVQPAAVVLLGAPVRGCLAGRRLCGAALRRWVMGGCFSLLRERALVRRGHSMLIMSGQVGGLVERFLAAGRFA